MNYFLALDTTSPNCCAALQVGAEIFTREFAKPAESLATEVEELLLAQNLSFQNLSAILVTNGPGSFSGIRIGLASAAALALGAKLKIYTASALLAQTLSIASKERLIISTINANENEVYLAAYLTENFKELAPAQVVAKSALRDLVLKLENQLGLKAQILSDQSSKLITAGLFRAHASGLAYPEETQLEPLYLKAVNAKTLAERA